MNSFEKEHKGETMYNNRFSILMLIIAVWPTTGCDELSPFVDDEMYADRQDNDNDGIPRPDDCDDEDPSVGIIFWHKDVDSDGFGGKEKVYACDMPSGTTSVTGDCDDTKKNVFPGASELCDNVDNNCNGKKDEGIDTLWYKDKDKDLFGNKNVSVVDCKKPNGYVADSTDCNDSVSSIKPGATEICDSVDQNCNGQTDEGLDQTWYEDKDKDTYGNPKVFQVHCKKPIGFVSDHTDCNDVASEVKPNSIELCDLVDNNCNGKTDEGLDQTWYEDSDKDSFGNKEVSIVDCKKPEDFVANKTDCDDKKSEIKPSASEVCNLVDDDCNGKTDEGLDQTWYEDADKDSFGNPKIFVVNCKKPDGHVSNKNDCDDTKSEVKPSANEVCNSVDDDCNGKTDEGLDQTWFEDSDKDTYGNKDKSVTNCKKPDGFVLDKTDCDDEKSSIKPGANEVCNSVDDDCNGKTDDGIQAVWYLDFDKDTYGDKNSKVNSCNKKDGYVSNKLDCNDKNPNINPGKTEVCDNNLDDNCNGIKDDALGATLWYPDADKDGYGSPVAQIYSCKQPLGFTDNYKDCNDKDFTINPFAKEACNDKIDNDCNGITDTDALEVSWYKDGDKDSYGNLSEAVTACSPPPSYVDNSLDCNDKAIGINPGATETCNNGIDDNCDTSVNQCKFEGLNLISNASHKILGDSKDLYPNQVVWIGDFNCDKIDDFAIGTKEADVVKNNSGAVRVFLSLPKSKTSSIKDSSVVFTGENAEDFAGASIAHVKDINSDGCDEILIGAPGNKGAAYLIYGSKDPKSMNLSQASAKWHGESKKDLAGFSVASADFNGDGISDIFISAPNYSKAGFKRGVVYFISGSKKMTGGYLSQVKIKWTGEVDKDEAGYVIKTGNVDGDKFSDLFVGAWKHNGGANYSGAVYSIHGSEKPSSDSLSKANNKWTGEEELNFAGTVIEIGDVNGDNKDDVFVGVHRHSIPLKPDAGTVYLFYGKESMKSGSLKQADIKWNGEGSAHYSGTSISTGDINNDGFKDVVIGSIQYSGTKKEIGSVHLFYGSKNMIGGSLTTASTKWIGENDIDRLGSSIDIKGDYNNDGHNDLLALSAYHDKTISNQGACYIVNGIGL
jgi:hypothetical protein